MLTNPGMETNLSRRRANLELSLWVVVGAVLFALAASILLDFPR
jgi:hypothetical protein